MDDLLQPYQPTPEDPFDLRKAGHLLRRTAFGGSLAARRELVRLGVDAAVNSVLAGAASVADPMMREALAAGSIGRVRAWRVWRMLSGRYGLAERMAYFWHGHFATSNRKVGDVHAMAEQMALFDRLGLGAMDKLLLQVSRDPAMLKWLDNIFNVKGRPNENYARELFELFALGRGNYTERDIQEAARAFTGWHLRDGNFHLNQRAHDDGDKEVFGHRGPFDGEDIVYLTVRRAESAGFLARKWLEFFVHPEPTEAEIEALAECYISRRRKVGPTLDVLLHSKLFFSRRAYRSRIKSPADFAIGLVRNLGARAAAAQVAEAMGGMGEVLLEPPSVEGWPGERAWLNSATWLQRINFAGELFSGSRYKLRPVPQALLRGIAEPSQRVRAALLYLLDGDVSEAGRDRVLTFAHGPAAQGRGGATALFQAVMTLPEAQLL